LTRVKDENKTLILVIVGRAFQDRDVLRSWHQSLALF
jgi:hypothetical protein